MIITCLHCGKRLEVEESMVGRQARCPGCQQAFTIQAPTGSPPGPAPAVAAEREIPMAARGDDAPQMPRARSGGGLLASLNCPAGGGLMLTVGRAMLLGGLVLVLLARGCDSIGNRAIARAGAKLQQAQNDFTDKWDRQMKDAKDSDKADIQKKMDKEKTELEKGDWADMRMASRDAVTSNAMWGYWHECMFIFGTIVLVLGLVGTAFSGSLAERILCMVMMAIITFSIYIGGLAWIGTIAGNIPHGLP